MCESIRLLTLPKGIAQGFKFPKPGNYHWAARSLGLPLKLYQNADPEKPFKILSRRIHTTSEATFGQDRVGTDGELRIHRGGNESHDAYSQTQSTSYVIGNPIKGQSTIPPAPPLSRTALEQLAEFVTDACRGSRGNGVLVLTGAGCSTESNIPDYRSPGGAYSISNYKPMTHQAFMGSAKNRSRYWARSFAGWQRFSRVTPNPAHESIARLQRLGWLNHLVTQNVDRLHHKAGSSAVLELHGTTHEVVCTDCRTSWVRQEVQEWLAELNPGAQEATAALETANNEAQDRTRMMRAGTSASLSPSLRTLNRERETTAAAVTGVARQSVRPDGDVDIENSWPSRRRPDGDTDTALETFKSFKVPPCPSCGGVVKPDVVFFGDSLPRERAERSLELARNASAVLVVGSSLAVWSAFRLVRAAKENGSRLAIVNVGPTRADDLVDLAVPALAGETMIQLAGHPSLLLPAAAAVMQ